MLGRSASSGRVDRHRPAVDAEPPSAISRMPKAARNRSSWPMPWRPATPRISPLWRAKLAFRELVARPTGSRPRRPPPPWSGLTAGRGGKVWAMERPMIISMISRVAEIGDGAGGDVPAVPEHGEVVAEGPHLAHPVRDEDDRHARRLEAGDDLAQPVDVAAGERRGRLVEEQDARLAIDRAGDLDLLLDGEVEVADLVAEVDVEAERIEMGADRALGRAPADHAGEADRARRGGACCRGPSGPGPASSPGTRSGCRGRGRRAASRGGRAGRESRSGPGRARSGRRAA